MCIISVDFVWLILYYEGKIVSKITQHNGYTHLLKNMKRLVAIMLPTSQLAHQ
jgi:hypothetical protein